jgi:ABC-2 type transport system ATP-binding protein
VESHEQVEVTFDGVVKRFGDRTALDGVSFTVTPGRVTGFFGPNGAGKTTTLRILVGLVTPDQGSALIGGRPYDRLPNPAGAVGVALDGSGFHPQRSGLTHLRLQARAVGVSEARVQETLERVDIRAHARRAVGGYSLGMRQRLALAHALVSSPSVLVLDEPTNGLDPDGVRWMREVLRQEAERGAAVLVSSHMLAEMENAVDDVVIIADGRVRTAEPLASLRALTQPSVTFTTADAAAAAAVLAGRSVSCRAVDRNVVEVTGRTLTDVARLAIESGIDIADLNARTGSLEDLYFDIVRGDRRSAGPAGEPDTDALGAAVARR